MGHLPDSLATEPCAHLPIPLYLGSHLGSQNAKTHTWSRIKTQTWRQTTATTTPFLQETQWPRSSDLTWNTYWPVLPDPTAGLDAVRMHWHTLRTGCFCEGEQYKDRPDYSICICGLGDRANITLRDTVVDGKIILKWILNKYRPNVVVIMIFLSFSSSMYR
jgi:hypothetical protein